MIVRTKNWWRCRRVFLNVRIWNFHLQIWPWGFRCTRAESGPNCFRLHEFCSWRFLNKEEYDEYCEYLRKQAEIEKYTDSGLAYLLNISTFIEKINNRDS
jgi:hypothetical protein